MKHIQIITQYGYTVADCKRCKKAWIMPVDSFDKLSASEKLVLINHDRSHEPRK